MKPNTVWKHRSGYLVRVSSIVKGVVSYRRYDEGDNDDPLGSRTYTMVEHRFSEEFKRYTKASRFWNRVRSAITGRFVRAGADPNTSIVERVKR